MRYDCDDPEQPELAHNFVEYSDSWSHGETRQALAGPKKGETEEQRAERHAAWLELIKRKMLTVHMACTEGEPITDPATITEADLDRIDQRVYLWFSQTWVAHLNYLGDLGNALGARLFASSDTSKEQSTNGQEKKPVAPARQRS